MTEITQSQVSMRKIRWRRFYDPNEPPSHMLLIRFSDSTVERPLPHSDKKQERIEWAWNQYVAQRRRASWLDDDTIPYLDVYTGTEIFAEAFGCQVHRPDDQMPFALPLISSASQVSTLRVPDLDVPCLRILFEIADELRRRAGSDAVLKMVDIQSPMDIAALIWDKASFYVAMLDRPEAVKELSAKVKQLLTTFLDEWFSRYGVEFVAHYPDYYMPKGITLSEDEVGAVGTDMFEAFFLRELSELSDRYDGIGIHCCANAKHQWGHFKRVPGLRLLNIVQPPRVLQDAYSYFATHVAQMHIWCGDENPVYWIERLACSIGPENRSWRGDENPACLIEQLPKDSRVVLQVSVESREHAINLSARIRSVLNERMTMQPSRYPRG